MAKIRYSPPLRVSRSLAQASPALRADQKADKIRASSGLAASTYKSLKIYTSKPSTSTPTRMSEGKSFRANVAIVITCAAVALPTSMGNESSPRTIAWLSPAHGHQIYTGLSYGMSLLSPNLCNYRWLNWHPLPSFELFLHNDRMPSSCFTCPSTRSFWKAPSTVTRRSAP